MHLQIIKILAHLINAPNPGEENEAYTNGH